MDNGFSIDKIICSAPVKILNDFHCPARFGKVHKEQGNGSGDDGGDGGNPQYLAIHILQDRVCLRPHIRCKRLIGLKGKEVGKGCRTHNDVLVRDAEFLFPGELVFGCVVFFFQ